MVGFGALVTVMIATSGDESFVMLSMFRLQALWLLVIMFLVALVAGWLVDILFKNQHYFLDREEHELELHREDIGDRFSPTTILQQLKKISFSRALLIALVGGFLFLLTAGFLTPGAWGWEKITISAGAGFALFIVLTVPDHFLEQHLWEHVVKKHLTRIFLWTFGALLAIHYLDNWLDIDTWIQNNLYVVLLIAVLVDIIPESGPHLIFVTLFAQGTIPFAILLASSIVQDGHGALPLLAVSRRAFLWLKLVNAVFGFLLGFSGLYVLT